MPTVSGTLGGTSGDDLLDNTYSYGREVYYASIMGGAGNDHIKTSILNSFGGFGNSGIVIDGGAGFDIVTIPDGWFYGFTFQSTANGIDVYYGDYGRVFSITNVELVRIQCFDGTYEFYRDPFFDDASFDYRSGPSYGENYPDAPYSQYTYFAQEDNTVNFNALTNEQKNVFSIVKWLGNEIYAAPYYPDLYHSGAGDDVVRLPNEANVVIAPQRVWDYAQYFSAGDGDDMVYGGDHADKIDGGEGFDLLYGGGGDDYIYDNPLSNGERQGGGIDGNAGFDTVQFSYSPDRIVNASNVTVWALGDAATTLALAPGTYFAEYLDAAGDVYATVSLTRVEQIVFLSNNGSPAHELFNAYDNTVDFRTPSDHVAAAAAALARAGRLSWMYDAAYGDDVVWLPAAGALIGTGARWDASQLFRGNAGNDTIHGSAGADRIAGDSGTDTLDGRGGNDTLDGGSDDDILDGGTGADQMTGGTGDDTYYVDSASDKTIEDYSGGTDLVIASVDHTLGVYVEDLTLAGAALVGRGNGFNNRITGNAQANTLYGLDGNDRIDGGAGADIAYGGAGDDVYIVAQAGDIAVEAAGAGTDRVEAAVTYVLGGNIETLVLTGTGDIAGSGNALANTITGNAGANRLDGRGGADTMNGGLGNDTYIVDEAGDIVNEAANAGTDTVRAAVAWQLGWNLENLVLTGSADIAGTGNDGANAITGNAGANVIDGMGGADAMAGGGGNDLYRVDSAGDTVAELAAEDGIDRVESSVSFALGQFVEDLTLTGSAAIDGTGNQLGNHLVGNAADNVLDGRRGADVMEGGSGNDTYVVDSINDVVVGLGDYGTDLVLSSVSFTLEEGVENLTLTGTAAINATGNLAANALTGNAAANLLDGGGGNDVMTGGLGDDGYVVDSVYDQVVELAGGGIDTVYCTFDYVLAATLENLQLIGDYARQGTGNAGANSLIGNSADNTLSGLDGDDLLFGEAGADTLYGGGGNDRISGGAGMDVMTGKNGADVFAWRNGDFAGSDWTSADRVTDFSHAEGDRIDLMLVDANAALAGNQAFKFIGSNAFSGVAGQLRYVQTGLRTFVTGDVNGDGTADFTIALNGVHDLVAADFML